MQDVRSSYLWSGTNAGPAVELCVEIVEIAILLGEATVLDTGKLPYREDTDASGLL